MPASLAASAETFAPADSLFSRLRAACPEDWRRYVEHDFVRGIGDGSLPERAFRHYLTQDYRFLMHFARAYALALYKADGLPAMRAAARTISALLDTEMGLHVEYCRRWGIAEAEMAATPEAPECIAYTSYVLERGMAGDLLDLHAALAPCVVGYAEIGRALAAAPPATHESNPYRDWIEVYAGADYQAVARAEIVELGRLWAARGTPGRFPALVEIFATATRLEIGFWDMGLKTANAGD